MAGESSTSTSTTKSNCDPTVGETTVTDGNAQELKNAFRQLLPCDVDEKILYSLKLTPLSGKHRKYETSNFEKLILELSFKQLRMFLIHYPAAPNTNAKNSMNVDLPTESWLAISLCKENTRVNALGVFNMTIRHHIKLDEVIAVGPMVHRMLWYTYYRYSYTDIDFTNLHLKENPVVGHLARQYNLSSSELLLLWALQRGETIKPKLSSTAFQMENLRVNVRLEQHDLTRLDIAIIRVTSGSYPRIN